ncbi:hypothetical protein [Rossellomorea aquimaris]|uniref:Uncharacterized protein n=1 Tax=Rossellomorea aquimaris TaxID=189382 RepID=A0A5D4TIW5_9BACI|nr:hypothetical protein [Rossellomorea aquimaris]TYS75760.1 hypothetical protein FZC80_16285 [Rossellomorea aquimaris]
MYFEEEINERPKMKLTPKGLDLVTEANDLIYTTIDSLVISTTILNNREFNHSEITVSILRDSLFTKESLAQVNDNYEQVLLLNYPESIREAFQTACDYFRNKMEDTSKKIKEFDRVVDEAFPESGEGYIEGYIGMRLEEELKNFKELIASIEKALDVFITLDRI